MAAVGGDAVFEEMVGQAIEEATSLAHAMTAEAHAMVAGFVGHDLVAFTAYFTTNWGPPEEWAEHGTLLRIAEKVELVQLYGEVTETPGAGRGVPECYSFVAAKHGVVAY